MALLVSALTAPSRGADPQSQSNVAVRNIAVAAASDLKYALDELVAKYREAQPDIAVTITYGSSGNFFAQLSNKAPFDMFLSADAQYPGKLIEAGLARKDSEFVYGVGRLVVWVPKGSQLDLERHGLAALADPYVRRISIANPRHAPYGRAAEAALKAAGIESEVRDRLVLGDNVSQAAQFAASGGADAAIIALSLVTSPAMKDMGRFWEVPIESYPRMEQAGVIMSWARDNRACSQFRDFMMSDDGRAVLERYGFSTPKE